MLRNGHKWCRLADAHEGIEPREGSRASEDERCCAVPGEPVDLERDVERSSEGHKMAPLRLFLADDHEIVRYGLRSLLETQSGWTVVGEAADGKATIEGVLTTDPDITLMDISMPVIDGLQAARKILASGSRTRILMLSIYDSKEVLGQVVDSGARGFVLKSDAARDLIAAVEAIHANRTFFTPKTAEIILDRQMDRIQEQRDRSNAGKKGHVRN
jgi:DNA-binding NarL/FixJ family response regulator